MKNNLIADKALIDSFIAMLPTNTSNSETTNAFSSRNTGAILLDQLPQAVKNKLPQLLEAVTVADQKYKALFNGDTSQYGDDHSSADIALIGYFQREGLTQDEADMAFRASKLYRSKWDEKRGDYLYSEKTINRVYQSLGITTSPKVNTNLNHNTIAFEFSKPINYKPIYVPHGMEPRTFIGPKISDGIRLFPAKALSSIVALGAVGKTSLLLSIATHIAAGKPWNGHPLKQRKVAMFFCEETKEEISRKFSAITENWSTEERLAVEINMLSVPLLGIDARLTKIERNQYLGSGITEKIIDLLNEFGLHDGLIILDHMQGFTSGDLNLSETATAISREANKLVDTTNSAVVLAAHIGKKDIGAVEVGQGFAVGSLAFENATRQMSGMIPMPDEEAKKYGLQETQKEYVWLGLAKNSYGASYGGMWLKKIVNRNYHTVIFEPVTLSIPIPTSKLTANQKLETLITTHLKKHPFTTKNMLDGLAGKDGIFKVSKEKLRDSIKSLLDSGEIYEHTVTIAEREANGIAKQVKTVLRNSDSKTADNQGRQ